MEARRAWVEAVAEAMTADGQDLIKVAEELPREVEDEMQQQPVDPRHGTTVHVRTIGNPKPCSILQLKF